MAYQLDELDAMVAGIEQLSYAAQANNYESDDETDPNATVIPGAGLNRRMSFNANNVPLPLPVTLPPPKLNNLTQYQHQNSSMPMLPSHPPTLPKPIPGGARNLPPPVLPSGPSSAPIAPGMGALKRAAAPPPPQAAPAMQKGVPQGLPPPTIMSSTYQPPPAMAAWGMGVYLPPPPPSGYHQPLNPLLDSLPPPPPADLLTLVDFTPQARAPPKAALPPPPPMTMGRKAGAAAMAAANQQASKPVAQNGSLKPNAVGEKFIMAVSNLDGSLKKSIEAYTGMTGNDLKQLVSSKLQLGDADYWGFAFQNRNYDKFVDGELTLREQDVAKSLTIKVQFMKQPLNFNQPSAVNLYWLQVKTMVVSGAYPITDYLAVKLGALHLQVDHGDFNGPKTAALLKEAKDLLPYMPQSLVDRYKIQYWQKRLLQQYSRYKGMSKLEAQLEYLRVARKSPAYGASIFEIRAGAYALLGIAEDGLLLSTKRNSLCGDWTFYPYEQLLAYNRTNIGMSFQTETLDVTNIGMHDEEAEAALAILHDYYQLFRSALDPSFQADGVLPNKDLFELPPKRIMLSSFPSRLELFKDAYQHYVLEANSSPLMALLEKIDADLDEGRNCDVLDLEGLDLNDDQWNIILKALGDTFVFRPTVGQVFVENFSVYELRLSNNPNLTPNAIESMAYLFNTAFPARLLNFANNKRFDKKYVEALANLLNNARRIDSIDLSDVELGDQNGLLILKSVKTNLMFRSLKLARSGLTDGFFFPLALILQGHPSVSELDLSGNAISDDGCLKLAEGMKSSRSIMRINLTSTKVGSHSIKKLIDVVAFRGRPNHLELATTKLSLKTAMKIASVLHNTGTANNLFYLDLYNSNISKKGAVAIAASLEGNRTLESLLIGSNDLDKDFMAILARSLRVNDKLKVLSLKNSSLGSDGYASLAEIIRYNKTLMEIDVSNNSISTNDSKQLGDAIASNTTLKSLVFTGVTRFGGEGAANIYASLRRSGIVSLNFDGCNIGDKGILKIADVAGTGEPLLELSLKDNNLSNNGLKAILPVFDRNSQLKYLNLEGNSISVKSAPELLEAVYNVIITGHDIKLEEDVRALIIADKKKK